MGRMMLTGAFLAEQAGVMDNKLQVWGGVLETWTLGPDRRAFMTLVVILQNRSDNAGWRIDVEVGTPNGGTMSLPSITRENIALDPDGSENLFVLVPLPVQFEVDGRHTFILTPSEHPETAVTVPLRVLSAQG